MYFATRLEAEIYPTTMFSAVVGWYPQLFARAWCWMRIHSEDARIGVWLSNYYHLKKLGDGPERENMDVDTNKGAFCNVEEQRNEAVKRSRIFLIMMITTSSASDWSTLLLPVSIPSLVTVLTTLTRVFSVSCQQLGDLFSCGASKTRLGKRVFFPPNWLLIGFKVGTTSVLLLFLLGSKGWLDLLLPISTSQLHHSETGEDS